ncbi:MAG: hypothetical protein E7773_04330 [Sphingomonas sp.]|uniref:hypothetical protein n=1 Tax=Sphingomonas sp. TaxID=28214 RepID=UPI00121E3208|nr:hypothetical protein [Sphingomonas sp.]THD37265.1 MAG: hypothetical protein E7773_04330 [Sphingomonas sp.]
MELVTLLDALKAMHGEVLTQIAALEAVVACPAPNRDSLSNARWRLMRASRARLKLLNDGVYPALCDTMPGPVAAFRADDAASRAASAKHIAYWQIDRIIADWPGYQAVSGQITARMRRRIADEQRAFYPALGRAVATPSVASRSGR